jgi:hypothetical protein
MIYDHDQWLLEEFLEMPEYRPAHLRQVCAKTFPGAAGFYAHPLKDVGDSPGRVLSGVFLQI